MRVLLLRSLGGHPARTVIDQDQAAAEWLLSTGLAVAADDPDTELTSPADDEPVTEAESVTSKATPRVRRSSRTATPGG